MGSDASMPMNVLRHVSLAAAHSPYAQETRRKLDAATDVALLAEAGHTLVWARQFNTMGPTAGSIDFDVQALGMRYLERALELDPQAMPARAILHVWRLHERSQRVLVRLEGVSKEAMAQAVAALPETERLDVLWRLMSDAYSQGANLRNKNDKAGSRAAWQRLSIYAADALAIGLRHPEHPNAGAAMFDAHIKLGDRRPLGRRCAHRAGTSEGRAGRGPFRHHEIQRRHRQQPPGRTCSKRGSTRPWPSIAIGWRRSTLWRASI